MISPSNTEHFVFDLQQFQSLKQKARASQQAALHDVAKQFEGIFLRMMIKSMRDAGQYFKSDLWDSQQFSFYQDLFDDQLSHTLSQGKGLGFAEAFERMFSQQYNVSNAVPASKPEHSESGAVASLMEKNRVQAIDAYQDIHWSTPLNVDNFAEVMLPYAQKATQGTPLDPHAVLAQAALETGWGQFVPGTQAGGSSHNLFGIKADARWSGSRVQHGTKEYLEGQYQDQQASFRAYDSFLASFHDYVEFLKQPRYAQAWEKAQSPDDFFHSLQESGYATDPHYAEKLSQIYKRIQKENNEGGSNDEVKRANLI